MRKILVASFFMFLLLPFTYLAEASQITDIVPKNVRMYDKGTYNVITMDIHFIIPNIRTDESNFFFAQQISITDDKGRNHQVDLRECSVAGASGMYLIDGKKGSDQYYTPCYSVEKDFKNFKVYFTPTGNPKSTVIGDFIVKENNQVVRADEGTPCSIMMTQAEKDANPNRIQDGIPGVTHNGECITDSPKSDIGSFFSGFWDMIRSWFHF
ncbi:MAG TPA: hypothetical protein VLD38_07065 [Nitrosopumilaceae archaeon]|nr:hypothetical protein [Nitrosopumilaceae archaeon]